MGMFLDILNTILNNIYVVAVLLLLFNLTIFIHELGHYLVGKWRGAKIDRFAVWFGPAIWSKTINGIEYRLGCIPLGGYVAFPQLAMEAVEGKSEIPIEKLEPLKPRDKIPILFAGSIANVFLGIAIACIVSVVGIPKHASDFDLHVGYVSANTPEQAVGIELGDLITSINEKKVKDWSEIGYHVALSLSEKVRIGIERSGIQLTKEIIPTKDDVIGLRKLNLEGMNTPIAGKIFHPSPAEKAGIQLGDEFLKIDGEKVLSIKHMIQLVSERANKSTQLTILRKGVQKTVEITPRMVKKTKTAQIGVGLSSKDDDHIITVYPTPAMQITKVVMITLDSINAILHPKKTGASIDDLSGPVGIGTALYQNIQTDFRLALFFLVLLNINLAIVNLLPIPVLDGGHILFSIIEIIRGKPFKQKFVEATQMVFIVLLLTFMLYVTFNDFKRINPFGIFSSKNKKAQYSSGPIFEDPPNP